MNRKDRDRGAEIEVDGENSRDKARRTERSDRLCVGRMMLVGEPG